MMAKVMVCSIFRDSMKYITRYFIQISNQVDYPPQTLKFVFVEGDSKDNTYKRLVKWKGPHSNVVVKKIDTGEPYYGSIVNLKRFKVLAQAANAAIEEVDDSIDYVLWLESDLHIGYALIKDLVKCNKDIVAPFIHARRRKAQEAYPMATARFYDTWAFRKNGRLFSYTPPFYRGLRFDRLFQIDSAGSVLLIKAEIIRKGARFTEDEVVVGFCKQAKELGYKIWLAPQIGVLHP